MCELCHSVLRVFATTVCARTLTDGDGTDGRTAGRTDGRGRTDGWTDGRRPLGEVATFEIGGVGSILLTNTAVLYGPDTPATAQIHRTADQSSSMLPACEEDLTT